MPRIKKPKEVKPNRYHQRAIALAKRQPIILTHSDKFESKYTSGAVELSPSVVSHCIKNGWLRPNNDALFPGVSQTFVPA